MKFAIFPALALCASATLADTACVLPVATAKVKDRVYTTTIAIRNPTHRDVPCEFIYARPNDPKGGTMRSQETIPAGETRVSEDMLIEVGAVGTLRLVCANPVVSAARIQASLDEGETFDEGRVFVAVSEANPIGAGKPRTIVTDRDLLAVEIRGKPAHFKVVARNSGGVVFGEKTYELPAFAHQIIDLSKILKDLSEAHVEIVVTDGDGGIGVSKVSRDPEITRMARRLTAEQRVAFDAHQQQQRRTASLASATEVKASITEQLLTCPFKAAPFRDPATGLCFLRDRWYDPSTGTFLTPDAEGYGDSSNLYAFCGSNPVGCSDPTGLAASMARSGWIVATDNRKGGRIRRFSPGEIARDPMAVRAFLGRIADVDPRAADAMIERAGQAWATGGDKMRVVGPGAAKAAGVYPLMASTAGAGIGGGIGSVAASAGGFGLVGTTMLNGFTGGVGGQAGADIYDRRFSGTRQYLAVGSTSAVVSLGVGAMFAGAGGLINGPGASLSIVSGVGGEGPVPASTKLIGRGDPLLKASQWIAPEEGVYDVFVHGSSDAFWVRHNGELVAVDQRTLATHMWNTGYTGGPVRLISCSTGQCAGSIGQDLANKLGAEVVAPDDIIWLHRDGHLSIGPTETSTSGSWRVFTPGRR